MSDEHPCGCHEFATEELGLAIMHRDRHGSIFRHAGARLTDLAERLERVNAGQIDTFYLQRDEDLKAAFDRAVESIKSKIMDQMRAEIEAEIEEVKTCIQTEARILHHVLDGKTFTGRKEEVVA